MKESGGRLEEIRKGGGRKSGLVSGVGREGSQNTQIVLAQFLMDRILIHWIFVIFFCKLKLANVLNVCLFFPLGRTLEEKWPLHKVTWSDHLTHNSHSQTAWLCLSSKFKINFGLL